MSKNYIKPEHSFNTYKYHWKLKPYIYNNSLFIEVDVCKPISNNIKYTFNVKGKVNKLIDSLSKSIDKEESFISQLRLAQKFDMNLFS